MNDFTAHIRETEKGIERQTVKRHCDGVAARSLKYACGFGASSMAELQGLLHDAGKLCKDFDDYINGRNNLVRGSIDHCFAGAKYLIQYAESSEDKY